MSLRVYFVRRLLFTLVVLFGISVVSWSVMQLPPGDYIDAYLGIQLTQTGSVDEDRLKEIRGEFGLDQPQWVQYLRWLGRMLQGDFGISFESREPVATILRDRVPLTAALTLLATLMSYTISMPLGVYCAVKQSSMGDLILRVVAFLGMAIPSFLVALVLLWTMYVLTGRAEVGLFSMEFRDAPWTWARLMDMLRHLPIPLLIIGLGSTGGGIRGMRAILLDELRKPYVVTARAKGVSEGKLLFKYPIRVASNPIVAGVGGILPGLISGGTVVEIVLGLPTTGPVLFKAILTQDMMLAASCLMIISALTVLGVFLADMALALVDPRIRFDR